MRALFLILPFLVLFGCEAFSNNFDRYDKSNGLKSNRVHDFIECDSKLYIFTNYGINIWDGFRFEHIDISKLAGAGEVVFAKKDSRGFIWFSTINGSIGWVKGKDVSYLKKSNYKNYQASSWVISMAEDWRGNIFFLLFSDKVVKVGRDFDFKEILILSKSNFVSDLGLDKLGNVTGFSHRFKFTIYENERVGYVNNDKLNIGIPDKIIFLGNDKIVFRSKNNLFIRDLNISSSVQFGRGISRVSGFFKSNNTLFISDNKKVYSFSFRGDFLKLTDSIFINDVSSIKYVSDGSLILSTLSSGFYVRKTSFSDFIYPFDKGDAVYSVSRLKDSSIIVGGYYGNLARVNPSLGVDRAFVGNSTYNFGLGRIFKCFDFGSDILVCSEQRGFILDRGFQNAKLLSFGLRNFCKIQSGLIYASSRDVHFTDEKGFFRTIVGSYSKGRVEVSSVPVDVKKTSLARFLRPTTLCSLKDSVIVASNKGLYLLSFGSLIPLNISGLGSRNYVQDLVSLGSGLFCCVSNGNFLNVFSLPLKSAIQEIQVPEGNVERICSISVNEIWICTDVGLYLCSFSNKYKSHTFRRFTTRDGLLSNEVNDITFARGKWWVATSRGLNILDADFYKVKKEAAPKPTFYAFQLNDIPADSLKDREMTGNAKVNFSFGCLSFRHLGNLNFRYRLSTSSSWIYTDKVDHELNSLSVGDYQIEVQARSPNSGWSASLIFPEFRILAPFWERGWVILMSSAIFFSMLIALVYNVQGVRIARLRLESEMTDASLKSLRSQMKPHFLSNILNSMHYFILSERPEESGNFVSRFSRLVRHMLDSSDKNYLPLNLELMQLREYLSFECKRADREVDMVFIYQKDADFSRVLVPTMLLQPLIENCLMHGLFPRKDISPRIEIRIGKVESARFQKVPADQLLVSNQGRLLLQVKDNGQGREASRNSRKRRYSESYGMRTISDRLRWIERKFRVSAKMEVLDLKDEKNNPCGTAVVLNLPLIETDRKFV